MKRLSFICENGERYDSRKYTKKSASYKSSRHYFAYMPNDIIGIIYNFIEGLSDKFAFSAVCKYVYQLRSIDEVFSKHTRWARSCLSLPGSLFVDGSREDSFRHVVPLFVQVIKPKEDCLLKTGDEVYGIIIKGLEHREEKRTLDGALISTKIFMKPDDTQMVVSPMEFTGNMICMTVLLSDYRTISLRGVHNGRPFWAHRVVSKHISCECYDVTHS